MSNSLQPRGLQHAWPPCPSSSLRISPKFMSIESVMPSNHLILCHLLLLLPSFAASGSFPMSWLFTSGGQGIGVSAPASVLLMNIQGQFPLGLIGLISLLSRDSQVSSPAPQFKSISSSTLSLLYGPTLTSIPGYWKIYSFDWASLMVQWQRTRLPVQETQVRSLGRGVPLEKEMATHSSILPREIPWKRSLVGYSP